MRFAAQTIKDISALKAEVSDLKAELARQKIESDARHEEVIRQLTDVKEHQIGDIKERIAVLNSVDFANLMRWFLSEREACVGAGSPSCPQRKWQHYC